jgi:hypothetical protein
VVFAVVPLIALVDSACPDVAVVPGGVVVDGLCDGVLAVVVIALVDFS